MINNQKTFEVFGYFSTDLLPKSNKYIIHNCDDCGKESQIKMSQATSKIVRYCINCRYKGERNPVKLNNLDLSGKNNPNYKDGRCSKIKICEQIGCKNQIDFRAHYCIHHSQCGERGNTWKGGISPFHIVLRQCGLSRDWRNKIFQRDNYICQACGKNDCNLEAHHIKHFSTILNKFLTKYNQFSPIEDKETLLRLALKYKPFWNLNNGITLCEDCHKKEHLIDRSNV